MSNKIINQIRDVKNISSSAKFALWIIADHANDEQGGKSWPSHQKIADQMCVSRSTVIRAIDELKTKGLLRQVRKAHFNTYFIDVEMCQNETSQGKEMSQIETSDVSNCNNRCSKLQREMSQDETQTLNTPYKKPLEEPLDALGRELGLCKEPLEVGSHSSPPAPSASSVKEHPDDIIRICSEAHIPLSEAHPDNYGEIRSGDYIPFAYEA